MDLLALISNVVNSWVKLTLENWLTRRGVQELINTWLSLYLIHVRH